MNAGMSTEPVWRCGAVLVLEDLPEPRRWLCELVRQAWPDTGWLDEAADLRQANALLDGRQYDVALLDWELPDGNAAGLIERMCVESPRTLVVVSTIHEDDDRVFSALRAGAQGYILKSQNREQVLAQLQALERGEPALAPSIAHKVLAHFRAHNGPPIPSAQHAQPSPTTPPEEQLTPREVEVLRLIAKGYHNAEASQILGITANTLGGYVKAVYRKLGVNSRAEAALSAARLGLAK